MYLPAEMMEIGDVSVAAKDKARFDKNRRKEEGLREMIPSVWPGSYLRIVDPCIYAMYIILV